MLYNYPEQEANNILREFEDMFEIAPTTNKSEEFSIGELLFTVFRKISWKDFSPQLLFGRLVVELSDYNIENNPGMLKFASEEQTAFQLGMYEINEDNIHALCDLYLRLKKDCLGNDQERFLSFLSVFLRVENTEELTNLLDNYEKNGELTVGSCSVINSFLKQIFASKVSIIKWLEVNHFMSRIFAIDSNMLEIEKDTDISEDFQIEDCKQLQWCFENSNELSFAYRKWIGYTKISSGDTFIDMLIELYAKGFDDNNNQVNILFLLYSVIIQPGLGFSVLRCIFSGSNIASFETRQKLYDLIYNHPCNNAIYKAWHKYCNENSVPIEEKNAIIVLRENSDTQKLSNEVNHSRDFSLPDDFFENDSYIRNDGNNYRSIRRERLKKNPNLPVASIVQRFASHGYINNDNDTKYRMVLALTGRCPIASLEFKKIQLLKKEANDGISYLVKALCSKPGYNDLPKLFVSYGENYKFRSLDGNHAKEVRGWLNNVYHIFF